MEVEEDESVKKVAEEVEMLGSLAVELAWHRV